MKEFVISESDIEAALEHLRALPHRSARSMDIDRQRLLNRLEEVTGKSDVKSKQWHQVAPGVFAIFQPFGVDLASSDANDGRLQVWLLIRHHGTDPQRVTRL